MRQKEQIEIQLSKTKMLLILLGSIAFVIIGIWFIINPPKSNHIIFGNETVLFITGIVSILFFGLISIFVFRKFSDNKPGLIINSEGVYDNSSGVAAGLIPWNDIEEIQIAQVMNQQFLMLIVVNPNDYINKISNPIKRNAMRLNYKSYGSPISISSNALQTNFDELHLLLIEKMKEYKS